jgi:hypothetical protein
LRILEKVSEIRLNEKNKDTNGLDSGLPDGTKGESVHSNKAQ